MPSRALTFLQEIRDAIESSDRLLLVVGPGAAASDYVRSEWQHALLFGKGVVPVLRLGQRSIIPQELAQLHSPDFRDSRPFKEAFEELCRILRQPIPDWGSLLTLVPSLPPHFLPRRKNLDALSRAILCDVETPHVISASSQTIALQGMGGIGKSVLAAAFARATKTRRAFTDGIIWLSATQKHNPLEALRLIASAFGERLSDYIDLPTAKARLPRLLDKRRCLIVVDDAWDIDLPMLLRDALGLRCRLLVTSRCLDIVAALGAQQHALDLLSEDEAILHLAHWTGVPADDMPDSATTLSKMCGYLPLAVSLCGAQLRAGACWTDIVDALREAELQFLDHPHGSVFRSMKVGVDALPAENRQRYLELAVFPGAFAVPETVIVALWEHTGQLRERHARQLIVKLKDRALLGITGDTPDRLVSLHDLQRAYLLAASPDIPSLHRRLIEAYRAKCSAGWQSGPKDGYFFRFLPFHLRESGAVEEVAVLLTDYRWLQAKLEQTGFNALVEDFGEYPEDSPLRIVRETLLRSAYALSRHPNQLVGQLWGRLSRNERAEKPIIRLLEQAKAYQRRHWLRPITASLSSPESAYAQSLDMAETVTNLVVSPDGRTAVTVSLWASPQAWDLLTGKMLWTARGGGWTSAVALHGHGQLIIPDGDGVPVIYDFQTGELTRALTPIEGEDTLCQAVAGSLSGRWVAAGYTKGTIRVWDLESDTAPKVINGHSGSVGSVVIAPDEKRIVSGSEDDALRVWALPEGVALTAVEFPPRHGVGCLAVSPDGKQAIVGTTEDSYRSHPIKLYDLDTGRETARLDGHRVHIKALALPVSGRFLVSLDGDGIVRVWDLKSMKCVRQLEVDRHCSWAGAVDRTGSILVAGGFRKLKALAIGDTSASGAPPAQIGEIGCLKWSPGLGALVTGADEAGWQEARIRFWNPETFVELFGALASSNSLPDFYYDGMLDLCVTPDGELVLASFGLDSAGDRNCKVMVWRRRTRNPIDLYDEFLKHVSDVWFSNDCRFLFARSGVPDAKTGELVSPEEVLVCELPSLTEICRLPCDSQFTKAVTVNRVGTIAVFNEDTRLSAWDLARKEFLWSQWGHPEIPAQEITALCLTPDENWAVSAYKDGSIRTWELSSGKLARSIKGHASVVNRIVPYDLGARIVSVSSDRMVKVWDLSEGAEVAGFTCDSAVLSCATVPQTGSLKPKIVVGDASGKLHGLVLESQQAWPENGF
jgi:WD40 repeat protein